MSYSNRYTSDWLFGIVKISLVGILLAMIIVPFLFVISVSLRTPAGVYKPLMLIPSEIEFDAWTQSFSLLREPLLNSFYVATGTAILSLMITIPGAYVFARKDFPGRKVGFYAVLAALLFPYILLIIPIIDFWYMLGLYNTIPGLWIAYQTFVTPFAIWILRDFFEKLPKNLEEAAQTYGCTQFGAFLRVILPLATPAVVAVGFLAFLTGWNDFLFSSMLTTGTGPRPAVVSLYLSTTGGEGTDWTMLMAQTLIIGTPPTVLYMFSRRYLAEAVSL